MKDPASRSTLSVRKGSQDESLGKVPGYEVSLANLLGLWLFRTSPGKQKDLSLAAVL